MCRLTCAAPARAATTASTGLRRVENSPGHLPPAVGVPSGGRGGRWCVASRVLNHAWLLLLLLRQTIYTHLVLPVRVVLLLCTIDDCHHHCCCCCCCRRRRRRRRYTCIIAAHIITMTFPLMLRLQVGMRCSLTPATQGTARAAQYRLCRPCLQDDRPRPHSRPCWCAPRSFGRFEPCMAESYLHTWCAHAWPINPHAPVGIGGVIELAPMPHSTIGIDANATQVLSSHLLGYL